MIEESYEGPWMESIFHAANGWYAWVVAGLVVLFLVFVIRDILSNI